jgi:flagellar motor switch protein FliN/FliY
MSDAVRIGGIEVTLTIELGRTTLTVAELLDLSAGRMIELDRASHDPIDLRVNGRLVARAEMVTTGYEVGVRILEIVDGDG